MFICILRMGHREDNIARQKPLGHRRKIIHEKDVKNTLYFDGIKSKQLARYHTKIYYLEQVCPK